MRGMRRSSRSPRHFGKGPAWRRLARLLALAPVAAGVLPAAPVRARPLPPPELAVDNGTLRRAFVLAPGGATTTRFARARREVAVASREFRFRLADGRELVPADFDAVHAAALPAELGARGVALRFASDAHPFEAVVAFVADQDAARLAKQVRLESRDPAHEALALLEVDVEQLALRGASFSGGGLGFPVRSSVGLFAGLEAPDGEARVEGERVTLLERPGTRARSEGGRCRWPWSARAVVGVEAQEGGGAELAAWLASPADRERPRGIVRVAVDELAQPSEALRELLAQRAGARATFGQPRAAALLHADAFSREAWFAPAPALAAGALSAALAATAESATPLALTLPLAGAGGAPLPLEDEAQVRAARKALLALLQHEGKVHAPGWFVHELPAALPEDPARQARLARAWCELFDVERRLARSAGIALLAADPAALSPFWNRRVDVVLAAPAALPAGDDEAALAARLALGEGAAAPWFELPPAATEDDRAAERRLRVAAEAVRFWRDPPAGTRAERNDGARPRTVELPARPRGWLRLHPWCEVLRADGPAPLAVELAPGEAALFVPIEPLAARDSARVLPRPGRFRFGEDAQQVELLVPHGTAHDFEWWDADQDLVVARGRVGTSAAYQRRPPGEGFEATLAPARGDDGAWRLDVAFATPRYRAERTTLHVAAFARDATTALRCELLDAQPPGCATPREVDARGAAGFELRETRDPARLAFALRDAAGYGAHLLATARLEETLEALAVAPPKGRALLRPPHPATPDAARRVTTRVLHDGALEPPPGSVEGSIGSQ